MSDDKHYEPGDFYRICDRSGFKTRARRTSEEWNGLIVNDRYWEARHPQDFVRGVSDNQTVPFARPRQVNQFLGPLTTTLTVDAASGSSSLSVVSSVRMIIGDKLNIILDSGVTFATAITSLPTDASIGCSPSLPTAASVGSLITDISAIAGASIG